MYSSSKSGKSDSISISKSVGNELLSRVKVGMTYEEVIDMLKYEGIDVGCSTIIQQYESSEGALYTFEYLSVDGSFVVSNILIGG